VSYGHSFRTQRPTRLAVVAIGYADGVPRQLSNRMDVLHRGRRLPQIGAITMDQLVVDATEAPDLEIGSVVTLLGSQGDESITPADWSSRCDTIPWEVLCGFKRRLPRLGSEENREVPSSDGPQDPGETRPGASANSLSGDGARGA
jgi:alanine racemase